MVLTTRRLKHQETYEPVKGLCKYSIFTYILILCYIVCTTFGKASEAFVVSYKTTRRHSPEDGILPRHHRENSNCLWSRYRHYAMG